MTLSQLVTAVHEAVLFSSRQVLRETALLETATVRPQVHLFTSDPLPAYVGCLTIRDFDPGEDAAWAIRMLGNPFRPFPPPGC